MKKKMSATELSEAKYIYGCLYRLANKHETKRKRIEYRATNPHIDAIYALLRRLAFRERLLAYQRGYHGYKRVNNKHPSLQGLPNNSSKYRRELDWKYRYGKLADVAKKINELQKEILCQEKHQQRKR